MTPQATDPASGTRADGDTVVAGGVDWDTVRFPPASDLEVAEVHSFCVGAGSEDVLVHNECLPQLRDWQKVPVRPIDLPARQVEHDPRLTVADAEGLIAEVARLNRDRLVALGTGFGRFTATIDGTTYVLGVPTALPPVLPATRGGSVSVAISSFLRTPAGGREVRMIGPCPPTAPSCSTRWGAGALAFFAELDRLVPGSAAIAAKEEAIARGWLEGSPDEPWRRRRPRRPPPLQPAGPLGTVAVASACIAYPQGLATEAAGGARRDVLPPGSRSRVDYAVRVGAGEDAVGVKVVSEELRASC